MSCQSRFDSQYWMLGAGALGRLRGMVRGRRREEGSGWGTHVYLWQIHVDIWQNKYNIVKLKNKIKLKKKHQLDISLRNTQLAISRFFPYKCTKSRLKFVFFQFNSLSLAKYVYFGIKKKKKNIRTVEAEVNGSVNMNVCSVTSDSLQPVDCSPPDSSVHGIFQARILELVAISYPKGSS